MQKVPFKIFANFKGLNQVMGAIITTKYGDFRQGYHVKRLADELQARFDDFKKLHIDIMAEADWEDEKKTKAKNSKYIDAQLDELFDTPFELKWAPLPVGIIERINPTPEQFTIIEYLMDPKDLDVQV